MIPSTGALHVVRPERREKLNLIVLPGRPLGAATIDMGSIVGLAGYLRKNSCTNVVDRFICPVSTDPRDAESVRQALCEHATMRMVGEPAWLEVSGTVAGNPVVVFLLSREQKIRTQSLLAYIQPGVLLLANGQTVETQHRNDPYRTIPLTWAEGYDGLAPDGFKHLQMIDSSSFNDVLDNPHSYYVVLNPRSAVIQNSGWVKVSNPVGMDSNIDLTTSFAVRTTFSDAVGPREIAVDETVSVAIGMREGEVVHVESIEPRMGTLRRRAFSFRHTVVRAVGATTMDMEKPLVRLPAGVLDILGLSSGSRVMIEALSRGDNQIRRVAVRALEEREQREPRLGGLLDVLDTTGSVDLPSIAMDLSLRNRLGIHRGDPVYVRPEFGTVFFEEFTTISFTLMGAAIGSFIANANALAMALTGTYIALSAVRVWRKFR